MSTVIKKRKISNVPVIISRGIVIFPESESRLEISRVFTHSAIKAARNSGSNFAVVLTQKDALKETPDPEDINDIGVAVRIRQYTKVKGESSVLVYGLSRVRASNVTFNGSYYCAEVSFVSENEPTDVSSETEAAAAELFSVYDEYTRLIPHTSSDTGKKLQSITSIGRACDIIANSYIMSMSDRQNVLSELDPVKRIYVVCKALNREMEIFKLEMEISSKVKSQLDKSQRDYYLREQLKVIQNELDDDYQPGEDEETVDYMKKINAVPYPDSVREKLTKEVYRLEKLPFSSAEYSLLKAYIDTCLEIPYGKRTTDLTDILRAQKILDEDHYGLEKVKERIYEFIAAKKFNPDYRGQILCFVGPPGVGKTSIVSGIAKCLDRKMVRISLGGIHDEADIRGHRKTYIGAMPGRIITALNESKVINPLILFDEVDKLGTGGYHGDPASALLEVLDVEQNRNFRDHFIEFNVDLSDCMFICTANTVSTIPRPLLDRMEIIYLNSYTMNEKIHIAKRHLLKKQLEVHKLDKKQITISDGAYKKLIELYTKESGVRNLEREIAKICRKAVKYMVDTGAKTVAVSEKNLADFSGTPKYVPEKRASDDEVGLVNGLAWTEVGGELLPVEAAIMPGTGKTELTGSLGDVMKESAKAAVSYIRTMSDKLGIDPEFYKNKDIHLHFPDGATPKDGPSAGIAITTCLISALTHNRVRHDTAMTGEITIRGKVLPIGGLKEKTMAAAAHGIKSVIIPADNMPDLSEIDREVKDTLEFIPVTDMNEVIEHAFSDHITAAKKKAAHVRTGAKKADSAAQRRAKR